jgi:hypothetical protein
LQINLLKSASVVLPASRREAASGVRTTKAAREGSVKGERKGKKEGGVHTFRDLSGTLARNTNDRDVEDLVEHEKVTFELGGSDLHAIDLDKSVKKVVKERGRGETRRKDSQPQFEERGRTDMLETYSLMRSTT